MRRKRERKSKKPNDLKKKKSSKEETFSPDSHRAVSHRLELVAREQAPDQVEGVSLRASGLRRERERGFKEKEGC